jgi:hypothetical protein
MKINLTFFTLIIFSCSTQKIVHYINEDASFQNYRTYYLLNTKGNVRAKDDQLIPRLESVIKGEMQKREYSFDDENPDLILRYELVAMTETEVQTSTWYTYSSSVVMNSFNQSILLFELKDRKSNKLVWHGSIDMKNHQELKSKKDPIKAAVELVFDSYPYKAGSAEKDLSLLVNE